MKAEVTEREKERFKDVMLVVLKMKEGATSQGILMTSRSQKTPVNTLPLKLPVEAQSC